MSFNGLSTVLLTNDQILAPPPTSSDPFPTKPLERTAPLAGASFSASSLSATSPNIVLINDEAVELTAGSLLAGQTVGVFMFVDGRPVPYEVKPGVILVLTATDPVALLGENGHYRLVLSSDSMIGVATVDRVVKTQADFATWLAAL